MVRTRQEYAQEFDLEGIRVSVIGSGRVPDPQSEVRILDVYSRLPLAFKYMSAAEAERAWFDESDIVVFSQCRSAESAALLGEAVRAGKATIYDVDSYLFELPGAEATLSEKVNVLAFLRGCSWITCSNIGQKARLMRYCSRVELIGNRVRPVENLSLIETGKVHILLACRGRFRLRESAMQFIEALDSIMAKYPEVILTLWGEKFPLEIEEMVEAYGAQGRVQRRKDPAASHEDYIDELTGMGVSFALVPLEDTSEFAQEPDMGYLELASLGIPAIFSSTETFRRCIAHKSNGLLVDNERAQWYGAMELMIKDAALRAVLGTGAFSDVEKNRNLRESIYDWAMLLRVCIDARTAAKYSAGSSHMQASALSARLSAALSSAGAEASLADMDIARSLEAAAPALNHALKELAGMDLPSETASLLGQLCMMLGSTENAEILSSKALGLFAGNGSALNTLGMIKLRGGDIEGAIGLLERAVKTDPWNDLFRTNIENALAELVKKGEAAFVSGDADEAVAMFQSVLRHAPDNVTALNNLGVIGIKRGELDEAEEYLAAALKIDPGYQDAANNLANLRMMLPDARRWRKLHLPGREALAAMAGDSAGFEFRPLVSIIMPAYNTKEQFLREAVASVLGQVYDNWELCFVDNGSTSTGVWRTISEYAAGEPRIRAVRIEQNLHIAGGSNKALAMAAGSYVTFLDSDDRLHPHAIFEFVKLLQGRRELDFAYSDNCTIDEAGDPAGMMLKPGWSPEFYLTTNYAVHMCFYSARIIKKIGRFNEAEGYRGVQDIDLKARLIGRTTQMAHIPKVLYDWRISSKSVASSSGAKPYVMTNAMRVFQDVLDRLRSRAVVKIPDLAKELSLGFYKLDFSRVKTKGVDIVIRTSGLDVDLKALRALVRETEWGDFRVHLMVMGSDGGLKLEPEADMSAVVQVHDAPDEAAMNAAIGKMRSEYIVFVGSGARPGGPDWLRELVGYMDLDPAIGAVGGRVLDAAGRIADGAYVFLDDVHVVNKGRERDHHGYWFNNVIAQNFSAVSDRCMITRRAAYLSAGGLNSSEYGQYAGADYCLRLAAQGLRTVFNPWCTMTAAETMAGDGAPRYRDRLRVDHYELYCNDPYYPAGMSIHEPYKFDFDGSGAKKRGRLRINFVLPSAMKLTGGPLAILEYANRLIDRGHDVSITTYPDVCWSGDNPFPWFNFKGKIIYKKLRDKLASGDLSGATQSESIAHAMMNGAGLEGLRDFMLGIGGAAELKKSHAAEHLLFDFVLSSYLIEVMPECDINIATLWSTAFPVYLSRKGKPVYFIQHYEEVFYSHWLLHRLAVRYTYTLPMYKVANSSWLKKQLLDKYGVDVPFSNNGIDLNDFGPMPKTSAKDGIIRVFTYSRPEDWKGFGDAVAAMEKVVRKYGDKVQWNVFGFLNTALPPDNPFVRYNYYKGLPFKELAKLYATSDIMLCPSWYESFPLPPLEAMACGTAVVTTDYGTEDYAFHEKNALIVRPRDVNGMAEAVMRLIEDKKLRGRLAKAGLKTAAGYGWDTAVSNREKILLDIYKSEPGYDVFKCTETGFTDFEGVPFEHAPTDNEAASKTFIRGRKMRQAFLVDNGRRRPLSSPDILGWFGLTPEDIEEVSDLDLYRIPVLTQITDPRDITSKL